MEGGPWSDSDHDIDNDNAEGFNEKIVKAVGVVNDNEGDGGREGGEESRAMEGARVGGLRGRGGSEGGEDSRVTRQVVGGGPPPPIMNRAPPPLPL